MLDELNNKVSEILLKFSDLASADFLGNIKEVLSGFLGWEALVAAFFIFAVFFYGLSIGKARLLLFLISIYIAKLFVDSFVYVDYLLDVFGNNIFAIYLGLFIISYIAIFLILDRSILKIRLSTREYPISKLLALSVVIIILLSNVVFTYLPPDVALGVKGGGAKYFLGDTAFFWWFLLSVLSILLLKRKKKRKD